MRNLLMVLTVTALAAPGMAIVNVTVQVDKAVVYVGQTATVSIYVNALPTPPSSTPVGVAALAGDIAASGAVGAFVASDLVFGPSFDRAGLSEFGAVVGTPGPDGGWLGFGSAQRQQDPDLMRSNLPEFGGGGNNVLFASYTITCLGVGTVDLAYVPGWVAGFKVLSTDKDQRLGTNVTGQTAGAPEPATAAFLALASLPLARRRCRARRP